MATVVMFVCFIGKTDVIAQDFLLPVSGMVVDAITIISLRQLIYWNTVRYVLMADLYFQQGYKEK
jgi:hypothetical protein